ncbi:Twitchin, partial [Sarcoptes scabiei]
MCLEADPYPEITWFHGTNTITDGGRHKITKKENGGNMYTLGLEITNPTLEDGGTYRCNAVNVKGESNANIALNFQSGDEEDEGPKFIGRPRIIPNETSVTMECRVRSKTKITVEWIKGSTLIEETTRHVIKTTKISEEEYLLILDIKEPGAKDGGLYKCIAKNSAGEVTANLNLSIEGAPEDDSIAPKFMEKPRIISEKDGTLILMECRVKCRPKPNIVWYHEGVVLKESSRIRQTIIEEKDDVYVLKLEIHEADIEDSGMYRCNVKNKAGESNANLSLTIEIIPVISQRPRIIRREHQQKIVIECAVKSANKPQITWIRESVIVREDSRHQVIVREERKGEYVIALEIDEPNENDSGAYKMKARNEKGEVITEDIMVRVDDEKSKKKKEKEDEEEERASKKKKVSAPRIIRGLQSE